MGKKAKCTPVALNDEGNRAFGNGFFSSSLKLYCSAIEKLEVPNHLYLSNRANAYLKLHMNAECVADCEKVLSIEPKFVKAYARKADALINMQRLKEAKEVIMEGLNIQPADE